MPPKAISEISFVKYSGCGNDFILIDNRTCRILSRPTVECVQRLCQRQNGIGSDGIILLETSQRADFRMRIFNADGSEAEMCGNGIRCLARFICDLGYPHTNFSIETMHQCIAVDIQGQQVKASLPPPTDLKQNICLVIGGQSFTMQHLDTGVPHVVIFVDDIDNDHYLTLAPLIRHHPLFAPKGSNVNFAKIISPSAIQVRTYERGVEQETLACGTGAVAVALTAAHIKQMESPITIHTRSLDKLEIAFTKTKIDFSAITMSGPAVKTFHGAFEHKYWF